MKDVSTPNTTPTPEPTTEGDSFLTSKAAPGEPKLEAAPPTEPKAPPAPTGAPEKYTDFKLPEGYQFDAKELEKATGLFKEMGLSQESAQKLVDHYAENNLQAARAPYEAWAQLKKEWSTEIASRFGERAEGVRADINKAIDSTLPPSLARGFKAGLDLTGAGTHPDLVEGLSILLKPLFEGTPVRGGAPSPEGQRAPGSGPISPAEAIYGHLRK